MVLYIGPQMYKSWFCTSHLKYTNHGTQHLNSNVQTTFDFNFAEHCTENLIFQVSAQQQWIGLRIRHAPLPAKLQSLVLVSTVKAADKTMFTPFRDRAVRSLTRT